MYNKLPAAKLDKKGRREDKVKGSAGKKEEQREERAQGNEQQSWDTAVLQYEHKSILITDSGFFFVEHIWIIRSWQFKRKITENTFVSHFYKTVIDSPWRSALEPWETMRLAMTKQIGETYISF